MFEEGFKRYNSVSILKVFGSTTSSDASITYKIADEKIPRYALIRAVNLESYETVEKDSSVISHESADFKDSDEYLESILKQFAEALKANISVNLVIAVVKKGRNVEFVSKAEFC